MAGEINGIRFEQAKSFLDIAAEYDNSKPGCEFDTSLFDVNGDGHLDFAEKQALSAYLSNQDKAKFDFDKDGKLDKAEKSAYEAYTIQRADEKREELTKDIATVCARKQDGSLDTDFVKKLSNEQLEEFIHIHSLPDAKEYGKYDKAGIAARVLLNYNRENNMNTNETTTIPKIASIDISPEEFLTNELSKPNDFLSGPFQ